MRVLALDVGDKRIGLALCDPLGIVATPHSVYQRSAQAKDIAGIVDIAKQEQAEAILVGMPISLNDTIGEQAKRVQRFIEALRTDTILPVLTCDERYSSVEADRWMQERGIPLRRRKELRDAVAAAVLLQSYLDTRRNEA